MTAQVTLQHQPVNYPKTNQRQGLKQPITGLGDDTISACYVAANHRLGK